jgi:hypothetical protein
MTAARPHIRSMQHNITTVNFAIDGNSAEGDTPSRPTRSARGNGMWTSWSAAAIWTSTRSETTRGSSSRGRS